MSVRRRRRPNISNDILTMCYQLDLKETDEDVVNKLRDGVFSDMYIKFVMSKRKL